MSDAGGNTAPASWTYDVHDVESGALLAEDLSPVAAPHQWRRPASGAMEAATFGYAHFQDDGEGGRELVLGWINEVPGKSDEDDGGGGDDEGWPPCGHPGNDGGGSPDDHPGDTPGGGDQDQDGSDHPGDSPSPPSSGECE